MEPPFDSEESSSGCESGWTLYLEHSCKHVPVVVTHEEHKQHDEYVEDDHNDDDMSMVSDASSGPPHFQEHQEHDEDEYNNDHMDGGFHDPMMAEFDSRKRRKILKQTNFYSGRRLKDLPVSLDDTASSPFFSFCNKDLKVCNKEGLMEDDNSFDYSQGYSTTYFEMI